MMDIPSDSFTLSHEALPLSLEVMTQQYLVRSREDDWTGVSSPTSRRKLQNRLNQRAYRTRKRIQRESNSDQKSDSPPQLFTLAKTNESNSLDASQKRTPIHGHDSSGSYCSLNTPMSQAVLEEFAKRAYAHYISGAPCPAHTHMLTKLNVFRALTSNADAIGCSGEWLLEESVSPFNSSDLCHTTLNSQNTVWPQALQPTRKQIEVPHHPWIDLLPLPQLRDNILRVLDKDDDGLIEDALCRDIVEFQFVYGSAQAGIIVWGQPWNPLHWEFSEGFLHKWGWLLQDYPDILLATNHWRSKRGLGKICFKNFIR